MKAQLDEFDILAVRPADMKAVEVCGSVTSQPKNNKFQ